MVLKPLSLHFLLSHSILYFHVFPVSFYDVRTAFALTLQGLWFSTGWDRDFWITEHHFASLVDASGNLVGAQRVTQCLISCHPSFHVISFPFSFEVTLKTRSLLILLQLSTRRQVPVCGKYLHDCTLAVALSLRGLLLCTISREAMKETSDTSDTSDDQPSYTFLLLSIYEKT